MGRVGKTLPTLQVDKCDRLNVRLDLPIVRSRSGGRRPRYANGFAESLFLHQCFFPFPAFNDTRHPTPDTLPPTPYPRHPTPYSLLPTPYSLPLDQPQSSGDNFLVII
ncbi:hypothetical protein [Moorena producens]|uniref:hypothetical protein n=1 Tax=Moorena producens TaxID=1155739 RepID=UPI003C79458A